MKRAALIAVVLLGIAFPAQAEPSWIVIGASDPSPTEMARQARSFSDRYPTGFLIQTSECGYPNNLFTWVIDVAPSAEAAQEALARLSALWEGAYVLRCEVRPRSLIAWGISAVDESIADLPENLANASDPDWASSAYPLPDGRAILVIRTFDPQGKGRPPGRRERVLLGPAFEDPLLLDEDCADAGGFAAHDGLVAFHCTREAAAGRPLHSAVVFDGHGKRRAEFKRCRDPSWSGDHVLVCQEETVTPEGNLRLQTKRIALTPGIIPPTKIERLWLPVGATDSSPAEIARRVKSLSREFPGGLVVQMRDCGGPENLFAWVAEPSDSKMAAEETLARLRTKAPEARLESCDARAGTLLAFRVSAVHESIADIFEWGLEFWSEADRVSFAHPLPDGRTILVARYFDSEDEGPLFGKSERVLLGSPGRGLSVLDDYCSQAGGFVTRDGMVAFHCVEESIAHLPFPAVQVFDAAGDRLAHIRACRDPAFSAPRVVSCQGVSYTSDRELRLKPQSLRL